MIVSLRSREVAEDDPMRGAVPTEFFDIMVAGEVVGIIQLRLGDSDDIRLYGGHVGYGVEPIYRRNGYASAALVQLGPIARGHGLKQVWITCQRENIASCRAAEKAGAVFEGTVTVPLDSDLYARGLTMRRYRLDV